MSDRLQESLRVVPMHPLEGGELDVLRTTPGPASTGHLGLVEADDGFSQSVIVKESPRLPTDGSIPASASRSV